MIGNTLAWKNVAKENFAILMEAETFLEVFRKTRKVYSNKVSNTFLE